MSAGTLDAKASHALRSQASRPGARAYRICERCVMDTSDPDIRFFSDGTCNHCAGHVARFRRQILPPDQAATGLQRLVRAIQRAGHRREYDCIIGVSGGVDSTFVAWKVKQLGLRPLAVHFDNGWDSELAVDNVRRTLETLGIDLYTHVVDWDEFRELQLSFLRASVPNCEIPTDHGIFALLMNKAAEFGVRYIITGSNLSSEGIMPLAWGYYQHDLKHLKAIHRQFGHGTLRTFPQMGAGKFVYYVLVKRLKYVPILNFLDYDKEAAKRLISTELGWRDYGGKHFESIYTRFFQGYFLPVKFGFDKRRAHLSTLICSGMIDRRDALAQLERSPYDGYDLDGDIEYVAKKLGLSLDELTSMVRAEPRKHADFPRNRLLFERLITLREFVKRVAISP